MIYAFLDAFNGVLSVVVLASGKVDFSELTLSDGLDQDVVPYFLAYFISHINFYS